MPQHETHDVATGAADLPPSLRVQRSGMQTVVSLLPYLWPEGNPVARVRVVVALVFLVLAKVATVYVPVIYGRIIDALAPKGGEVGHAGRAGGADRRPMDWRASPPPGSARCATRCSPPCSSARCGSWRCARSAICTGCRCASTSTARPAACRA